MAKHGPHAKSGARYPCGQLRPTMDGPTPEQVEHRHALVGGDEKNQRYAAYPLGVLYARRLILSGDHYAGQRYAALFMRAVHPLMLPSILGNLIASGGFIVAMAALDGAGDPEKGAADRLEYLAARQALDECGSATATAVDDLCIYDHAPRTDRRLAQIRDGLDALHRHFDLVDTRSRAASRA